MSSTLFFSFGSCFSSARRAAVTISHRNAILAIPLLHCHQCIGLGAKIGYHRPLAIERRISNSALVHRDPEMLLDNASMRQASDRLEVFSYRVDMFWWDALFQ